MSNAPFRLLPPPSGTYASFVETLRADPHRPRVAWDNQWLPPNRGWELEKIAYRFYNGHFDFFGKRGEQLIYPEIICQRPAGSHYHSESSWGMDALHVGPTAGCGGVILYIDGKAYPAYDDGTNQLVFSSQLVEETNDRVTLEFTIEGVGPPEAPYTVHLRPTALAGQTASPIELLITGGKPDAVIQAGIGLTRLKTLDLVLDTSAGAMGAWGWQEPAIGWIRTGLIYPPTRYPKFGVGNDDFRRFCGSKAFPHRPRPRLFEV